MTDVDQTKNQKIYSPPVPSTHDNIHILRIHSFDSIRFDFVIFYWNRNSIECFFLSFLLVAGIENTTDSPLRERKEESDRKKRIIKRKRKNFSYQNHKRPNHIVNGWILHCVPTIGTDWFCRCDEGGGNDMIMIVNLKCVTSKLRKFQISHANSVRPNAHNVSWGIASHPEGRYFSTVFDFC